MLEEGERLEKLYTIKEVSEILKVNVNFIHTLRKAGLIKVMKLGSFKIRESSLREFLEKYDGKDLSDPLEVRELR